MSESRRRSVYSRTEVATIRANWSEAGMASCPECEVPLTERAVPPHAGVPYVRRRIWLLCQRCGRSALVESPRTPPGP